MHKNVFYKRSKLPSVSQEIPNLFLKNNDFKLMVNASYILLSVSLATGDCRSKKRFKLWFM